MDHEVSQASGPEVNVVRRGRRWLGAHRKPVGVGLAAGFGLGVLVGLIWASTLGLVNFDSARTGSAAEWVAGLLTGAALILGFRELTHMRAELSATQDLHRTNVEHAAEQFRTQSRMAVRQAIARAGKLQVRNIPGGRVDGRPQGGGKLTGTHYAIEIRTTDDDASYADLRLNVEFDKPIRYVEGGIPSEGTGLSSGSTGATIQRASLAGSGAEWVAAFFVASESPANVNVVSTWLSFRDIKSDIRITQTLSPERTTPEIDYPYYVEEFLPSLDEDPDPDLPDWFEYDERMQAILEGWYNGYLVDWEEL